MPPQKFLISGGANGQDDSSEEDAMFDDWVLVDWEPKPREKPQEPAEDDFNPMSQERVRRETEVMHSGSSALLLLGRSNRNYDQITLRDFAIKRVLDKGSFGKVFLVECTKNGKLYAMKRLNKDVVLEKNQVENIKNEKEILFQADHPFVNSMEFVF